MNRCGQGLRHFGMEGKKMKKAMKVLAALGMCASLLTACGGGGQESVESTSGTSGSENVSTEKETDVSEMYTVTMAYIGNEQADMAKVEAAMNEMLAKEVGAQIHIIPLGWGSYQQQLQLMLSGGEKLDIVPVLLNNANSYVSSGQVIDMSELIDQYGTNIKASLGEDMAKISNVGGYVFGVPVEKEWYTDSCILMRKDIVDKYGLDVSKVSTLADCEEIFETVKQNEPNMKIIVGSKGSGLLGRIGHSDVLLDGFGVLENGGQSTTVKNMFETETYLDLARTTHDFYEKGYIDKDMPTTTDSAQVIMKAGNAFCYASPYKPGVVEQDSLASGYELVAAMIQPCEPYCTNNGVSFVSWGIAQNCTDPEITMQVLDFMYGSAEFMNLYNWGIEGEHYVVKDAEKDIIGFPDGVDAYNTAYNLNLGWELPNQFNLHIWEGNTPENMKAQAEMNKTSMKSNGLGFMYDYSSLSNELTALSNVQEEYLNSIVCGVTDPDEIIPELNEKLYKAGLQKVIDEKQRQFDEWLAAQE